MLTKKIITEEIEKRKSSNMTKETIDAVYGFFEYYNYDIKKLTQYNYFKYLSTANIRYRDAIWAHAKIKSILYKRQGVDKKEWPLDYLYDNILASLNWSWELQHLLTADEWNEFQDRFTRIIELAFNFNLLRQIASYSAYWYGVRPRSMYKMTSDDIKVHNDYVSLEIERERSVKITDPTLMRYFNIVKKQGSK